jgi:hypothetical protein
MKLTRLKMSLLAAAVCATALFVSAGAASASASGCTENGSGGNVNTCIAILGHGLFVDEMTASADVLESTRTLQVCLHGPSSSLPRCTAFEVVHPGGTISVGWFPNRDVPAGEYCARTWRKNADGSHTLIGQACENVHS